ncbi:MAG: hypothetical protein J5695_05785 [Bacteroidales bacterium]|nr:hypothetical protein [Bacteroidales bacterium]MBO4566718.1 hypothetical protein [Bacteroidales bacterium]
MALTNKEIEELQEQLKQKKEELQAIYDKLTDAGIVPLADDFLDMVAGGGTTVRPLRPSPVPSGPSFTPSPPKATGTLIPFPIQEQ